MLGCIDENLGISAGRIQVEVPNELLGSQVKVLVNERQQSEADKQDK